VFVVAGIKSTAKERVKYLVKEGQASGLDRAQARPGCDGFACDRLLATPVVEGRRTEGDGNSGLRAIISVQLCVFGVRGHSEVVIGRCRGTMLVTAARVIENVGMHVLGPKREPPLGRLSTVLTANKDRCSVRAGDGFAPTYLVPGP
jgi:hypothetical protein